MIMNMVLDGIYRIKSALTQTDEATYKNRQFIESQIRKWECCAERIDMLTGERYYTGIQDILLKDRTVIGKNGELEKIDNIPNNHVIDNQYKKLVDQKTNHILGRPLTFLTKNEQFFKYLKKVFDKEFQNTLKSIAEDSLNEGMSWLYPYYKKDGTLGFKVLKNYECIPSWTDNEHTELEHLIRVYDVIKNKGTESKLIKKVELYTKDGIDYYELSLGGLLVAVEPYHQNYILDNKGNGYNWQKIPLIPFKSNKKEIPLINCVKSLQDGLNQIITNFENSMEEDIRNTIMVLINYDGTSLEEFRHNLATYGAVKIRTSPTGQGDVKTLNVEVNAENYKSIITIFKKAIIENGMGYDAKDDRLGGNPNRMNIQSMYSDIELYANNMETEFQMSLEKVLWYIVIYLKNNGFGDYANEEVEFIFNRDMPMNETEIIGNIVKLKGIVSDETLLSQIPWINDAKEELKKIKQEQEANEDYSPFANDEEIEDGDEEQNEISE